MTPTRRPARARRPALRARALVLALSVAFAPALVQAQDERESLEQLRQTTLGLIEALVQSGVLTRDKADALIAAAQAKGTAVAAAEAAKPAVVRVPYVPQVVRDQIRDEVREEVLSQAKVERWGVPNATAEWTDRIAIEGDVRFRSQNDRVDAGNPSPESFLTASLSGVTRAADFASGTAAGVATGTSQDNANRLLLRARLGINAKVTDNVSAGLRLATGSATSRVSTNQTLGNDLNRYTFLLDRAFIKIDPTPWASLSAGRIPNPWFNTDMVWSENLAFDGIAAGVARPAVGNATLLPFATLGYFPIRQGASSHGSRDIVGGQVGLQWEFNETTRLKVGLSAYDFQGFEGHVDGSFNATSGAGASYGQYQYEAGLRQRGNTLFLTNNPLELQAGLTPNNALWGLASRFRPVALTAAAEFSQFAPYVLGLTGEVVRNSAYNRNEIQQRTGVALYDARVFGVQLRGTLGWQQIHNAGEWQATLGYRWLGSDAVPDAFVDSDLGGGGTNLRGFTLGFNYGLARDTQLGARFLSARTISSPTVQPWLSNGYGLDSLQVDLNVRF